MSQLTDLFVEVVGTDPLLQALVAGLVIAGFNAVGALSIVAWRNPSERMLDGALGFAAGVMLAASFTSLILPGIEAAQGQVIVPGFLSTSGVEPVLIGFFLGVLLLDRADAWVPHVHVLITGQLRENGSEGAPKTVGKSSNVSRLILFIVAITLHNMPEGLAVGVGFGAGNIENAMALMLAIGLQNIPEGLAVSIAARNAGFGDLFYATITGIRAGIVEIPLALFGAWAVVVAEPLLPYAMGLAAGGMLFVISDEIIPETHGRGHERIATMGTMVGLALMLALDVTLAG